MVTRRQFMGAATVLGTELLVPPHVVALGAGEPSLTARGAAAHRAAHQLLDAPLVFADPLALPMLGSEGRKQLDLTMSRRRHPSSRAMRAFIVMRSRYAEDELAQAFARGVRQYIVLGAGLDTFGCRNTHGDALRVFEVDHPATQAWKQKHLVEQGMQVPPAPRFVAVDFEKDALGERLVAAGFKPEQPAFISWLGVTMYLTRDAVMQTLGFVAKTCAPGSEITFDYSLAPDLLNPTERYFRSKRAEAVAKIGEPWISTFEPAALVQDLKGLGFAHVEDFGAQEANGRYFARRGDEFRVVGASGRMLRARV